MKRILLFFLLMVVAVISVAESPSWPRWRGPISDGISSETGWNPVAL